jgi:hypothetical protein
MSNSSEFDEGRAHRYFSADCFNRAWTLIDKANRTPADNEQMLLLSLASLWHWTQRDDCSEQNLSIGYWQVARVYALLGDAANARKYAEACLAHSHRQPPFFLAYAHEAIARAAFLRGDLDRMAKHVAEGRRLALQVTEVEERSALEKDLDTLRPPGQ